MLKNERTAGLILGTVAGDCLGTPYVFMKSRDLFSRSQSICWEIAETGVCSQLMMSALGEVVKSGVERSSFEKAYRSYIDSGHEIDCVSWMWAENCELSVQDRALCGNQLLIRQIPVVLAGIGWDRQTLVEHIENECRITHQDEESIEYAQLYGLCLQGILQGKSRVEIWDILFENVRLPEVRQTLLSSYYERPNADGADFHHASVAFGHAMYHFWHDTPFISGLRSVILAGGATDVNAAATGALIGAWQGPRVIPGSWIETMFELTEAGTQIKKALENADKIVSRAGMVLDREMFWHASRVSHRDRKNLAKKSKAESV